MLIDDSDAVSGRFVYGKSIAEFLCKAVWRRGINMTHNQDRGASRHYGAVFTSGGPNRSDCFTACDAELSRNSHTFAFQTVIAKETEL